MDFLIYTGSMLVILGIMVLVHEFGHFAVAKLCGVRVEIFSIGFGKRLIGFRRGDTDYRLSLLPLGGYVKMAGEMGGDGAPLTITNGGSAQEALVEELVPGEEGASAVQEKYDPAGDLNNHPRWQRVLIAVAGPVANFILAMVLMTGLFLTHMEVPDYQYQTAAAVIDSVPPNSPAAKAGIKPGDRITKFDGIENPTWEDVHVHAALSMNRTVAISLDRAGEPVEVKMPIEAKGNPDEFDLDSLGLLPIEQKTPLVVHEVNPGSPGALAGLKPGDELLSVDGYQPHSLNTLITMLQSGAGKPVELTVGRQGKTESLKLTPVLGDPGDGSRKYMIGFKPEPPPFHVERYPLSRAVAEAATFNKKNSTLIVEVLHRMVTLRMSLKTVSGPIGIAQVTGRAVTTRSWPTLVQLMSVISLNLGIFNLVPIPLLDGGVITLLLIESALRRDLNQKFKERIYQTAFVFLMLFAAFVMFNDIVKLHLRF